MAESTGQTLEICIPTYNESDFISETVRQIGQTFALSEIDWKIVVSDNGSTDEIAAVNFGPYSDKVRLLKHDEKGKGAAIKRAFATSAADLFCFTDADLSVDPLVVMHSARLLKKDNFNVIIGSRFHKQSRMSRGFFRNWTSKLFNFASRLILGVKVDDTQCPMKIMDEKGRKVFLDCQEDTWFTDIEFIKRCEAERLRLGVVPVIWEENRYADRKSKLKTLRDGFRGLAALLRIRRHLDQILDE